MIKTCLTCIILSLLGIGQISAQEIDSMYVGKVIPDETFSRLQRDAAFQNLYQVGKRYMPFSVKTLTGDTISNDSLKGKVCLLVFFYPGSNQINSDTLKAIQNRYSNKPFRIYLFTQETSGLKEYMQQQGLNFPLCFFRTVQDGWKMNFYNSIPSYALLSKDGIVAKVAGLEGFKPDIYNSIIADLLK
jgi:peroxiredoxin